MRTGGFCFLFGGVFGAACLPQAIALTGKADDLGVVQEAVENRRGAGNVADQLAPILQRPVRRHQRRTRLVTPHHHFEEVFAGTLRQLFHPHVVDDEQVGFEVLGQHLLLAADRLVVQEVADYVEDRTIEHDEAGLQRLEAKGLRDVAFAHARQSSNALLMFCQLGRRFAIAIIRCSDATLRLFGAVSKCRKTAF